MPQAYTVGAGTGKAACPNGLGQLWAGTGDPGIWAGVGRRGIGHGGKDRVTDQVTNNTTKHGSGICGRYRKAQVSASAATLSLLSSTRSRLRGKVRDAAMRR
ncbi:hypothetical protein FVEN_g12966 [Fusarium venenatum]|uniref:Uncharacterized protein n=2 Tax=Fusarium venenatum TaxID=56646 RepID=A0A2L2T9U6_9HYPO|nr:uncharacterized protein FVRRES_04224 [Fusarium venenatum]KAG8352353.1 hypothetical protein FVEN_g12966 [Fusarium venenatum]CEI67712.1 unnamed protein product [Fusarium venenatum]